MNSINCYNEGKIKIKRIKTNVDLLNLKSDYFLQKLFFNMKKYKRLEILKYNKKLQKRLNLSINDYKEYSQIYSNIEIELKLNDNIYGKFINISNEDKEYYHIYFDNSKKEIKKYCLLKNDNIKKIKIIIEHQIKSFKNLFYRCKCISSIFFKKFHRVNIVDMSLMLSECSSLKEFKFSNFNTNSVINLIGMFSGCSSLKELNLNNYNTNNVTDMNYMFGGCLDELKLKIKSQFKNFKEEAFYNY